MLPSSAIPDTGGISQGVAGYEARFGFASVPGLVCCPAKKNGAP